MEGLGNPGLDRAWSFLRGNPVTPHFSFSGRPSWNPQVRYIDHGSLDFLHENAMPGWQTYSHDDLIKDAIPGFLIYHLLSIGSFY